MTIGSIFLKFIKKRNEKINTFIFLVVGYGVQSPAQLANSQSFLIRNKSHMSILKADSQG